MPLPGDSGCGVASALGLLPARQPTAAVTWWFVWCTATSVTMLARKQPGLVEGRQPVGSATSENDAPPSVERNRPAPVAA